MKSEALIFHSWMSISFVTPSTNDNLVVTRLNCSQHPAEPKHAKIGHRNRDPKGHPKKQEWLSIYKGTTNDLTLHAKFLPQKPSNTKNQDKLGKKEEWGSNHRGIKRREKQYSMKRKKRNCAAFQMSWWHRLRQEVSTHSGAVEFRQKAVQ